MKPCNSWKVDVAHIKWITLKICHDCLFLVFPFIILRREDYGFNLYQLRLKSWFSCHRILIHNGESAYVYPEVESLIGSAINLQDLQWLFNCHAIVATEFSSDLLLVLLLNFREILMQGVNIFMSDVTILLRTNMLIIVIWFSTWPLTRIMSYLDFSLVVIFSHLMATTLQLSLLDSWLKTKNVTM